MTPLNNALAILKDTQLLTDTDATDARVVARIIMLTYAPEEWLIEFNNWYISEKPNLTQSDFDAIVTLRRSSLIINIRNLENSRRRSALITNIRNLADSSRQIHDMPLIAMEEPHCARNSWILFLLRDIPLFKGSYAEANRKALINSGNIVNFFYVLDALRDTPFLAETHAQANFDTFIKEGVDHTTLLLMTFHLLNGTVLLSEDKVQAQENCDTLMNLMAKNCLPGVCGILAVFKENNPRLITQSNFNIIKTLNEVKAINIADALITLRRKSELLVTQPILDLLLRVDDLKIITDLFTKIHDLESFRNAVQYLSKQKIISQDVLKAFDRHDDVEKVRIVSIANRSIHDGIFSTKMLERLIELPKKQLGILTDLASTSGYVLPQSNAFSDLDDISKTLTLVCDQLAEFLNDTPSNVYRDLLDNCEDAAAVVEIMHLHKTNQNQVAWSELKKEMCRQIEEAATDKKQCLIDKYRDALRLPYDGTADSFKFRLCPPEENTFADPNLENHDGNAPKTSSYRDWVCG